MKRLNNNNPFTITFGKQPNKLINRYEDTDSIVSSFMADNAVSQTYMIEGLRGSGKTVLMTTVAKTLEKEKKWVVINLNPTMDLLSNFAIRLNASCNSKNELLDKGFNISAGGFGIGINGATSSNDYVGMIDENFKAIIKKKKRVLITIDEVSLNDNMKVFASQFQIFVRQDYPIFLIMTGLSENINKIQNDPALTFLLRSPKIITGPLSILQIARQYKSIFETDDYKAKELAELTKGFAFAFQALGVAYWNNRNDFNKTISEYEELLDDFVYKKIWESLTLKEREIVRAISKDKVKTNDICIKASITNSTFSKYREALIEKGIIETPQYGFVSQALPRFYEVVKNYKI